VNLTVAGFVLALVAIPVSVIATWHWGNRRRKILFAWEATALVPGAHGSPGELGVTYRGLPVNDPYLLRLSLLNAGPKDLATADFDNNQPLVIALDCTMYGLLHSSHPRSTLTNALGGEGVIKLNPVLLRHRDEWSVEAVVGGVPSPEIDSPLIDTAIITPSNRAELAVEVAGVIGSFPLPVFGGRVINAAAQALARKARR
jgi:hypothetical protein